MKIINPLKRSGDRDLPQEYLVNLPQIKQCILPDHFGRAVADQDDPKKIISFPIRFFIEIYSYFYRKFLVIRIQ